MHWVQWTVKDFFPFFVHNLFASFSFCFSFLAASDHLPEVSHHHADPDPGSPADRSASVSHSRGIDKKKKRKCSSSNSSMNIKWHDIPTQRDLLGIQRLLNSSEASLHQLTALLDCRGLNKVWSPQELKLGHLEAMWCSELPSSLWITMRTHHFFHSWKKKKLFVFVWMP